MDLERSRAVAEHAPSARDRLYPILGCRRQLIAREHQRRRRCRHDPHGAGSVFKQRHGALTRFPVEGDGGKPPGTEANDLTLLGGEPQRPVPSLLQLDDPVAG
jgi:hypothetical protein